MDPDAALDEIRQALATFTASPDYTDQLSAADDLATHVQGLDRWLSDGEPLPMAWQANRS